MTTDTTERGLETLIVESLIGEGGYVAGDPDDYDREYAVDTATLFAFLRATQPEAVETLGVGDDGPPRRRLLHRLRSEIDKRGTIDSLRNGVRHGPVALKLFYGAPSPDNAAAAARFAENIFGVTRQLRYSRDEANRALDLALFVNGLPVVTLELKNRLTGQTVEDAVEQYRRDREPKEPLFRFGRCIAHFALDDNAARLCTHLRGKDSWFLPFDKGWNGGAGNPPNPGGVMTEYLWKEILARDSLTDIVENYAQIVTDENGRSGPGRRKQIFPRLHQLDVVRRLLADAAASGPGRRYLIQHSAGSGKSNSIAWLAHRLIGLETDGRPTFDSVIVVTDRRVLDRQIHDTIRQFAQVSSIVGHAEQSGDLRAFLRAGKKVVITTIQKFPVILDEIGNEHRGRRFAIVIDEAHSGQGGRTTAKMHLALAEAPPEADEWSVEDEINRLMAVRKILPNASYFAFTATPKNRTLEIFGDPLQQEAGKIKHAPFHSYTMKQAIQEGFILDVLRNYMPVHSYYRLMKTVEDDPAFDADKARRKLRRYMESHDHAIRRKAEIMIDHFHERVIARRKIGGKARAMVVTAGVPHAIQYFHAFRDYLKERKSPYRAIVAFSGERDYGGESVTEAALNGFPGDRIAETIRQDPYRFLIVADKFQTGYDEPLLHTMYVDKILSGVKAVQTLSRLNRAHPLKHDTFILDFVNDAEGIGAAFEDYYRTTVLGEETDPDKLHDLKAVLDGYRIYFREGIDEFVTRYLEGRPRDTLDPILDACVAAYMSDLDEDGQVSFKGKARAFLRTYDFLAMILPYGNSEWEKLSIFLNFLVPKLPAPREEDLSRGILEAIDMDSYRVEARASMEIALADADAEIAPVPMGGSGGAHGPDIEPLSVILREFNELFGAIDWRDADKIGRVITEDLPEKVLSDRAYRNAKKNSDAANARIEHDAALQRAIFDMFSDHSELVRQFSDNPSFQKWLSDSVFKVTYDEARRPG